MAKIDIITLIDFTAVDGSIVASGATVKFDSEMYSSKNVILIRPKIYRNRNLFEGGYSNVVISEIPNDFTLTFGENDFYTLTPAILYDRVCEYLNSRFGQIFFEIKIVN